MAVDRTVRDRYFQTAFTLAPGGGPDTPETLELAVGDVILTDVRLVIPRGHAFFTGFQLLYSGAQVLPFNDPPDYFQGDGSDITYPVGIQVTTPITFQGYNADQYPHTFHLTVHVTDWMTVVVPAPARLTAAQIEGAR